MAHALSPVPGAHRRSRAGFLIWAAAPHSFVPPSIASDIAGTPGWPSQHHAACPRCARAPPRRTSRQPTPRPRPPTKCDPSMDAGRRSRYAGCAPADRICRQSYLTACLPIAAMRSPLRSSPHAWRCRRPSALPVANLDITHPSVAILLPYMVIAPVIVTHVAGPHRGRAVACGIGLRWFGAMRIGAGFAC